jgi:hypothetical protein
VLLKILFKVLVILLGAFLVMIWLMDINHIDEYVDPSVPFWDAIKHLIEVGLDSIPMKDLWTYYKDNMLFLGIHKGITNSVCILASLPLIPLYIVILTRGWGGILGYTLRNLMTTYVYVDTGEFAFEEMNDFVIFLPLINFAVKLMLIWAIFELSPFILLITLAINIIQLFWIKLG